MIKVIIFDLDGLLINSQPIQYKSTAEAFSEYGFEIDHIDWKEWVEKSDSIHSWIKRKKWEADADLIREKKIHIYKELVKKELELMPGAQKAVKALSEKFRLCVGSHSRVESIQQCLDKFNLSKYFKKFVSDQDTEFGKPHPDVFIEAAQVMKASPSECIIIEDSIAGLEAAKAAKMKCVIVPDPYIDTSMGKYIDANGIIESLNDLTVDFIKGL